MTTDQNSDGQVARRRIEPSSGLRPMALCQLGAGVLHGADPRERAARSAVRSASLGNQSVAGTLPGSGQQEIEVESFSAVARADGATVCFNDAPHDCQAKPGTSGNTVFGVG